MPALRYNISCWLCNNIHRVKHIKKTHLLSVWFIVVVKHSFKPGNIAGFKILAVAHKTDHGIFDGICQPA